MPTECLRILALQCQWDSCIWSNRSLIKMWFSTFRQVFKYFNISAIASKTVNFSLSFKIIQHSSKETLSVTTSGNLQNNIPRMNSKKRCILVYFKDKCVKKNGHFRMGKISSVCKTSSVLANLVLTVTNSGTFTASPRKLGQVFITIQTKWFCK